MFALFQPPSIPSEGKSQELLYLSRAARGGGGQRNACLSDMYANRTRSHLDFLLGVIPRREFVPPGCDLFIMAHHDPPPRRRGVDEGKATTMSGDPGLRRRPAAGAERRGSGAQRANASIPNQPAVSAVIFELGGHMERLYQELR